MTVTQTVTQKGGGGAECPLTATPVSAGQSGTTTGAQRLTGSAGDGADVSSAQVTATANAVTTTATAATAQTTAAAANATAAATYKPGNGASPRGGVMSGAVLAGLGVLGVMLAM